MIPTLMNRKKHREKKSRCGELSTAEKLGARYIDVGKSAYVSRLVAQT